MAWPRRVLLAPVARVAVAVAVAAGKAVAASAFGPSGSRWRRGDGCSRAGVGVLLRFLAKQKDIDSA